MSSNSPSARDLYHSSTTTAKPDAGTTLDATVPETATVSPETTSFNSTKIPDVASSGPSMSTMLLSFGIITVIGLAVAMTQGGVSPKAPKENLETLSWKGSFCISGKGRGWRSYGISSCQCTTLIPLKNRMNWSRSSLNMGEMQHLPRHHRASSRSRNSSQHASVFTYLTLSGSADEPRSPPKTQPSCVHRCCQCHQCMNSTCPCSGIVPRLGRMEPPNQRLLTSVAESWSPTGHAAGLCYRWAHALQSHHFGKETLYNGSSSFRCVHYYYKVLSCHAAPGSGLVLTDTTCQAVCLEIALTLL